MKKIFALMTIAACSSLFFTNCASEAGTSKHPYLVVNNKDKPVVLEKIRTTEWAKNTYETMIERVTPHVERHKTDPEWILSRYMMNWEPGKHYTDFYASRSLIVDSMSGNAPYPTVRVATFARSPVNAEGRAYRLPPIEELTPYDTSEYMNLINPSTGQKERAEPWGFVESINGQINRLALDASIIYWLTGQEAYAKFAADILDRFVRGAYHQNPIHGNGSFGYIGTQTLNDAVYQPLMLVYDFVHPFLLKKRYEMTYYQTVWERFADRTLVNGYLNNWFAAESCTMMYAALLLEDESKRDFYITHFLEKDTTNGGWGHLSVRTAVETWLTPDGHWREPGGYHPHPIANLLKGALTVEKNGRPVMQQYPSLFKSASVMMKYVFPNLRISSFGNTSRIYPSSELMELGMVFSEQSRPEELPQLQASYNQLVENGAYSRNNVGWYGLLTYLPEVAQTAEPYQWHRSGSLDFAQLYLQRNGTDRDYGLMYAIQGATHNHNHVNGMSMELYGAGDVMGIDPGTGPYYEHPLHMTYFVQWAAHNTVVAAGSSSSVPYSGGTGTKRVGQLEMKAMEPLPEAEALSPYVSFTDSRYIDQSTQTNQQRTMALVRTSDKSGYYVDIFRSDNRSRNDYMYHNIGNSVELLASDGQPISMQASRIELVGDDYPGFRHISDVKATGKYPNDVVAMFTMLDAGGETRYMKAYMPNNPNHNYYTGYSPRSNTAGRYNDLPVPTLMVQAKGEAWSNPFITVFEPYFAKDGSSIQKVTRLNRNTGSDYVTLLVDGKDGEQQYIFQGVHHTDRENVGANYQFKGYFGAVSLKNNEIQYIYLGQGKKLSFGGYVIESQGDDVGANILFSGNVLTVNANRPITITVGKKGITTVTLNAQQLQTTQTEAGIKFSTPAVKDGALLLK